MLVVDLGQSGSRYECDTSNGILSRGKLSSESVLESLGAIFELLPPIRSDIVALSCTGFNGIVPEPEKYGQLCAEYFRATKVAIIDDGLAGFIGALNGGDGVVLSIGGGVVAVGGHDGKYAHRDGLGSTFGDEGGGFWLGKLAITKALGIRQGRGDDKEMLDYFTEECIAYDKLPVKNGAAAAIFAISTAKKVLDSADAGVLTTTAIVDEGAYLLAQTVVATWFGCGGTEADFPEIVIKGGPARNASYSTKIAMEVNAKLPNAVIVQSAGDNLAGATWIAQNMRQDAPPLLLWSERN